MKVLLLAASGFALPLLADTTTPPVVAFGATTITVSQTSGEVRIPVTISGPPLSDFFGTSVKLKAVEGSATWPENFDSIYHTISFTAGETNTTKTLVIGIPSTESFVGTKTFTVRIENDADYNVGSPSSVALNIKGSISEPAPKISTRTKKISKSKVRVIITATDFRGRKTIKKLVVRPEATRKYTLVP